MLDTLSFACIVTILNKKLIMSTILLRHLERSRLLLLLFYIKWTNFFEIKMPYVIAIKRRRGKALFYRQQCILAFATMTPAFFIYF
jgi:hypothetical protein